MKQKTYTQLKEEIEKGCGKTICSDEGTCNYCGIFIKCEECKTKLQTLKESRMIFIQEELEFLFDMRTQLDSPDFNDNDAGLTRDDIDEKISQLQTELKELEDGK